MESVNNPREWCFTHGTHATKFECQIKLPPRRQGNNVNNACSPSYPLFHLIPTIPDQMTYVGSDREDEEAQYLEELSDNQQQEA
jgi:hypothetical protein